jgi:hypothetical protein
MTRSSQGDARDEEPGAAALTAPRAAAQRYERRRREGCHAQCYGFARGICAPAGQEGGGAGDSYSESAVRARVVDLVKKFDKIDAEKVRFSPLLCSRPPPLAFFNSFAGGDSVLRFTTNGMAVVNALHCPIPSSVILFQVMVIFLLSLAVMNATESRVLEQETALENATLSKLRLP